MRTLLSLLTDLMRAAAPAPAGLAFAPGEAILAAALGRVASAEQLQQLYGAVQRCSEGGPGALAHMADSVTMFAPRPEAATQLNRVGAGLADLLALRAALHTPRASAQLQIQLPELFHSLRYLELPPAPGQPHVAVIGRLAPGAPLTPAIPPRHPLLPFITVTYDAGPGPLLSSTIGSGSTQGWEADRVSWRQPAGPDGDLRLRRRELNGSIITRRLSEPISIQRPALQIELHPLPQLEIYMTTLRDERNQPLCIFFQAHPAI